MADRLIMIEDGQISDWASTTPANGVRRRIGTAPTIRESASVLSKRLDDGNARDSARGQDSGDDRGDDADDERRADDR